MEDKKITKMINDLASIEEELKELYDKLAIDPLNPEDTKTKVSQEDIDYVLEIVDKLENILK